MTTLATTVATTVLPTGTTILPATPTTTATETSGDANPCISTAWIRPQSLEHATIRRAGVARVLCIPGLPCGTPGHLLRECRNGIHRCDLITYREVCAQFGVCITSTAPVSQLSHTFGWASFRVVSKLSVLELTSLSAHPLGFTFGCNSCRLFDPNETGMDMQHHGSVFD